MNTKTTKLLILVAALLAFMTNSHAQQSDEYIYIKECVQIFSDVKNGVETKIAPKSKSGRDTISNLMNNLILQRNALKKAKYRADQFVKNKNFGINSSAALISNSLGFIILHEEEMISLSEEILNKSERDFVSESGTFQRKIQEGSAAINEGWDLYAKTSISVTYAIVEGMDKDPMSKNDHDLNKKISRLVITRKEVNSIKDDLTKIFRSEISAYKSNKLNELGLYQMPPIMLNQFLEDKWKTKDEK